MIKTIAKILLAIAILWTLAFVFKLGNSFAASTQSTMYKSCYEDAKSGLGKKRAKQYCKCTSTMIADTYDTEFISWVQTSGDENFDQFFGPAVRHCNINPNAFLSTKLKLSGSELLRLKCKQSGLSETKNIVIDESGGIATVNSKLGNLKSWDDSFRITYMADTFKHEIRFVIRRDTAKFYENWDVFGPEGELLGYEGTCRVFEQQF